LGKKEVNYLQEPRIVERKTRFLTGMEFYGDPFQEASGWTTENEIGKLWKRFSDYIDNNPDLAFKKNIQKEGDFEVHVEPAEYKETKNYYVFVGKEVDKLENIPPELVVKVLPACTYAVFTLQGKEITSNWGDEIYKKWLPNSGYEEAYKITIEFYDNIRFKGMEGSLLEESELDVLFPIKKKQ
jgi:AraC family transcriptional regulator